MQKQAQFWFGMQFPLMSFRYKLTNKDFHLLKNASYPFKDVCEFLGYTPLISGRMEKHKNHTFLWAI